jgi:hypothetical protein
MIRQDIYVKQWDWTIHAFFAVTDYWVDDIMDLLWQVGCDGYTAEQAYHNLAESKMNSGLCFSSYRNRETVMVIAKTTSAAQFFNSFLHEMCHLQSHVCDVYHLNPKGEDIAYFTGDVAMQLYPKIEHLLCDCCRSKKGIDYEEE